MAIVESYQVKYTNKWGVLLQQQASVFEKFVTVDRNCKGKVKFVDQFGLLEFEEKLGRMGETNLAEAPTVRRAMRPRIFSRSVGYDEWDGMKLGDLDLPVSETIDGLKMAAARTMDKVMLDGFLGVNFTGEDGTSAVQFSNSQLIEDDYAESGSSSSCGLTLDKLRAALQMLMDNDAWREDSVASGDQLVMACSTQQLMNLLRTTEATSADYVNVKALVDGKIDTFMGFKFLRSNCLPVDDSNIRTCLAWVKSRAMFGLWDDFKVKISTRDDLEETLQIRAKFACGATRLEEKGFVKVMCLEK